MREPTEAEKKAQRDYELGKGSGVSVESVRERNARIELGQARKTGALEAQSK